MLKAALQIVAVGFALAAVGIFAFLGYDHTWTGFPERNAPGSSRIPAKTLWDWLDLLIVPSALVIGAYLWEGARRRSDEEIETDRQRQATLDAYFENVSKLLLGNNLASTNPSERARHLVRTQTLAALRQLDRERKSQILQFLYEAELIQAPEPVIQLNGADFSNALLDGATLSGAELRGVYFGRASIRRGRLIGADLRGSDFSGADFYLSDLSQADLTQASLIGAKLQGATLTNSKIEDVDLKELGLSPTQRAEVNHAVVSRENSHG